MIRMLRTYLVRFLSTNTYLKGIYFAENEQAFLVVIRICNCNLQESFIVIVVAVNNIPGNI